MMRNSRILALVALVIVARAWAGDLPLAKPEQVGLSSERLEHIREVFEAEIEAGRIAGVVGLVARGDDVAYLEGIGYRDAESKSPMTPDTIFRIYSMTKPVTSVAAMMLFEEGHFLLTDPVSRFLPELSNLEVLV
ncbi:MAG: serine hydrolase domain-containing protein, partial [Candidatus Hydrogenedentota bacterium]